MSAQGATLGRRGTMLHLPIWPVAVLVTAVAAVTIGVTMIGEEGRDASQPFTLTGEAANSTTAIREAGIVVPVLEPGVGYASTTAIREQGVTLPVAVGISHVPPSAPASVGYAGLENPGAYLPRSTNVSGLENPGAYVADESTTAAGSNRPIVIDGELCPQCR